VYLRYHIISAVRHLILYHCISYAVSLVYMTVAAAVLQLI
jgi:hypothetical protein